MPISEIHTARAGDVAVNCSIPGTENSNGRWSTTSTPRCSSNGRTAERVDRLTATTIQLEAELVRGVAEAVLQGRAQIAGVLQRTDGDEVVDRSRRVGHRLVSRRDAAAEAGEQFGGSGSGRAGR